MHIAVIIFSVCLVALIVSAVITGIQAIFVWMVSLFIRYLIPSIRFAFLFPVAFLVVNLCFLALFGVDQTSLMVPGFFPGFHLYLASGGWKYLDANNAVVHVVPVPTFHIYLILATVMGLVQWWIMGALFSNKKNRVLFIRKVRLSTPEILTKHTRYYVRKGWDTVILDPEESQQAAPNAQDAPPDQPDHKG